MKTRNSFCRNARIIFPALFLCVLSAGCDGGIYDDLDPCETTYRIKFRYDYNMKYADAFPAEVGSVAVWAFDSDGKLVWSHKEEGDALAKEGYAVEVPLPTGKYDFVSWCGLSDDGSFAVDSDTPQSKSELATTLLFPSAVKRGEKIREHNMALTGLYHNVTTGVEIKHDPSVETTNDIVLSLVKDTNYFKILLQNLDGTTMKDGDFSFYITADNERLEHDNIPVKGETFHHLPWKTTLGEANLEGEDPEEGTVTTVSGILAEMHTSRLIAGGKNLLVVHRNSDNKDIIRIPLIDYLLLVKGNYRAMTDQEYLDRQDEYSLTFFIDKNLNWYREIGIYVNSWHVVPPQDATLH